MLRSALTAICLALLAAPGARAQDVANELMGVWECIFYGPNGSEAFTRITFSTDYTFRSDLELYFDTPDGPVEILMLTEGNWRADPDRFFTTVTNLTYRQLIWQEKTFDWVVLPETLKGALESAGEPLKGLEIANRVERLSGSRLDFVEIYSDTAMECEPG